MSSFKDVVYRGVDPPSLGMPKHRIISPRQIEVVQPQATEIPITEVPADIPVYRQTSFTYEEPRSLISSGEVGLIGGAGLLGGLILSGVLVKQAYDYMYPKREEEDDNPMKMKMDKDFAKNYREAYKELYPEKSKEEEKKE